ncbi:MAG: 4Fe-4S binding protein [Candidatus Pacebacteria bacterium]|nr:4Fe-4S binding protein [Candidatus Paceibacterota bacterium]
MINKKKQKKNNLDINAQPGTTDRNLTGSWRTFKPEIDKNKCIGCKLCSQICPERAISMKKIKGQDKAEVNYDYCKGCAVCAKHCPVKAIIMKRDEK